MEKSQFADLEHFVVPPKILVEASTEFVNITESVSLNCFVQNNESHTVILWTKNSVPAKSSERIHLLHNGSLIIYDAKVKLMFTLVIIEREMEYLNIMACQPGWANGLRSCLHILLGYIGQKNG